MENTNIFWSEIQKNEIHVKYSIKNLFELKYLRNLELYSVYMSWLTFWLMKSDVMIVET